MRFTGAVKTKVGKLDVNNPLLLMTIPKELRKNQELMKLVKENANELQTHFDTRATLLDILKVFYLFMAQRKGDYSSNQRLISMVGSRWTFLARWGTRS